MCSYIGWGNSNDSCTGNPYTFREAYRFMSGFQRCGLPWIHPNGYPTKYVYSGDPVTNTGWICPYTNDQRFMMSTGPVNVAPGDTQVIVVAQVIARGTSNLNSITALRQLTEVVKNYYNSCYTSPPIGIEPLSNGLPTRFQLFQNYPNPFNSKSKIKYQIAKLAYAKLTIYNTLGQEIEILVSKKLEPGSYEAEWDAANYPSGIYFYRLSSGDLSETKKMVLIR